MVTEQTIHIGITDRKIKGTTSLLKSSEIKHIQNKAAAKKVAF